MNTEMQRRLTAPLVCGLLVCLLGSSGFAAAAAMAEVEPNDSVSTAQSTPVPAGGLTVSGAIGDTTGTPNTDVDFFTFEGTQGDTPLIETIGATKPDADGTCHGFPSVVTLYDSSLNLLSESMADCATPTAAREARIDNYTLAATGTYYVAVAEWPHIGATGAITQGMFFPTNGGDYQLAVSGVNTPPPTTRSVKHVPIQVRHWHQDEHDFGRRNGRDPITVAILSMKDFDAMTVDANSLTFGATGNEKSLFRCRKNGKDIGRDGHMVCYFKPDVANFQTGDRNGVLKGKTKSGQQIEGSAALKIFTMPSEKRGFRHHDKHGNGRDDHRNGNDKGNR